MACNMNTEYLWILMLMISNVNCDGGHSCTNGHTEVIQPLLRTSSGRPVFPLSGHGASGTGYRTLHMTFTWRREPVHIVLTRHDIVPARSVSEWEQGGNITEVERLMDRETIFYQGKVLGTKFSFAGVSLAKEGLTGYIQLDGEGIYIEPVLPNMNGSRITHRARSCFKETRDVPLDPDNNNDSELRFRRATSSYTKYLEVLVVADTKVVKFVGKDKVKSYLLGLMNIVNAVYHEKSLGAEVEVVTVKILYMDEAVEKRVIAVRDPKRTVDQFCQWASSRSNRGPYYQGQPSTNHDVAVLLTRHKFGPSGYAPITGLCVPMRNCALIRDDGFTSAFVVAHEIGHIFGLMHGGHGNECHGREYTTSIMASTVQSSFHHYWWSTCSKAMMADVIDYLTCLNNNPHDSMDGDVTTPIGRAWSLDQQCRLEFGDSAKHCRIFSSMDYCAKLWCSEGPNQYTCKTKNVVPLDGTQCGPTEQWYCLSGQCGYHGNQQPVNGGWSNWSNWSECLTSCGIGFKRRSRQCDSPSPDFGGKGCEGERENTDTCISQGCTEYEDVRAQQCSIMDSVFISHVTHIWRPYQMDNEMDSCKLTCISDRSGEIVTFDSLVNSGTPCSYDEPNSICVNGKCLKIGCDGVRGSSAIEDTCGVCNGDGTSCKAVQGVYKKTFEYSAAGGHYETVIVLPKGSRDISIKEASLSPHFLAIQDTFYYQYQFNGDGQQGSSKQFALDGAWFRYSNNGGYEELVTKGPLHRDANVMIYPMDWTIPAHVNFKYTVDKNDFTYEENKYRWKFEQWSPCSVSCGQGVQKIIYGCYDRESEEKVSDDNCRFLENSDNPAVTCERIDCSSLHYGWRMSRDWSQCTQSCGLAGLRHQLFECERRSDQTAVAAQYCVHIPEPLHIESCNRKPCWDPVYKWVVTTDWTQCTATCGEAGTQYQRFYCGSVDKDGNATEVDDNLCSDLTSPKESRACNRLPCIEHVWFLTDEWSDCTELCGDGGVKWRTAECRTTIKGEVVGSVSDEHCDNQEKPSESEECNRRPCFRYEWAALESWSQCSHSCGELGTTSREVVCTNVTFDDRERRVNKQFCSDIELPDVGKPCNRIECDIYEWVTTDEWSDCSESCGNSGIQTKVVRCQLTRDDVVDTVDDALCIYNDKEQDTRPCNRIPCHVFEWKITTNWTECPTHCDVLSNVTLSSTRGVGCVQTFLSGEKELTDDSFCDMATKPTDSRPCPAIECATYKWAAEDAWSDCSTTCGENGTQQQLIQCIKVNKTGRSVVDNTHCVHVTMPTPATVRACMVPPCILYRPGEPATWSDCSVTCGDGTQSRMVKCVLHYAGGREVGVDEIYCQSAKLSLPQRSCTPRACDLLEWGAGAWSTCSRSCGEGTRARPVYCGDPETPAEPSRCPGKTPGHSTACNPGPCQDTAIQRPGCHRDRATFCHKASARLCGHPAYMRVCCRTCQGRAQGDQGRRYYRRRGRG